MVGKIKRIINLVGNMGWRYTVFRMRFELLQRTGLLKKKFPAAPPFKQYISLKEWKDNNARFFFDSRESLNIPRNPQPGLKQTFDHIKEGKLLLFNSVLTDIGTNYDWVTNPDSGFHYDVKKHWTEIADYSKEAGDIKFVWEKSRFSYLYDITRYDYHYGHDCAEFVFRDICSWIKSNPVNCGPNYRCSQEMSLRVMNWVFALYYYRNSPFLTEDVFMQVQYALYWHMDHVYKNIDFSRIAVRNNHAITETLGLYFAGLFFPSLPGADVWKEKGKAWFEEEVAYQVYEDGTYLQFSMNYHRIVAQLLTWAIVLSEKNGERFSDAVYDRAKKSMIFLRTCMVEENGWLPNYGANDGALFFRLNNGHFRDYRPQLQALAVALGSDLGFSAHSEDVLWYGLQDAGNNKWQPGNGAHSFKDGGYYIIREPGTLTFIRCGGYKDRPSQADNLHLDIWYKGENIFMDAGSYKYNTDGPTMRYFTGTAAHNTVMLDDKDQMLKGGHFIWYYWPECLFAGFEETNEAYIFKGAVNVFKYIKEGIVHARTIVKRKDAAVWEVKDELDGMRAGRKMRQLWHLPVYIKSKVTIAASDSNGANLQPHEQDGWYSSLYAQKEKARELYFSTENKHIDTTIKVTADP